MKAEPHIFIFSAIAYERIFGRTIGWGIKELAFPADSARGDLFLRRENLRVRTRATHGEPPERHAPRAEAAQSEEGEAGDRGRAPAKRLAGPCFGPWGAPPLLLAPR